METSVNSNFGQSAMGVLNVKQQHLCFTSKSDSWLSLVTVVIKR